MECFLYPVENRTATSLQGIIRVTIAPGATIVSDMWRAYDGIDLHRYRHLTVNQGENFVDPVSGAHIRTPWRDFGAKQG